MPIKSEFGKDNHNIADRRFQPSLRQFQLAIATSQTDNSIQHDELLMGYPTPAGARPCECVSQVLAILASVPNAETPSN